jgi:hypothetical protein
MCKGTTFFWTFSLIGIHWGCSDLKLEQEATEILSEDQDGEDVAIIESADGLQFTQNKPDSGIEATVGFSKQGHVSYKGDFKNDQPHGLWTTFSRMENHAGRDIKRRASIMASTLCGMKMAANEWKGLTRTGKSMGVRLAGTQTEQGGNINSMISGSQKEPGQPGIIKEIFFQK